MIEKTAKWGRKFYSQFVHSIAFFPALLATGFLALAIWALELDNAGLGERLNERVKWLTLKDPETARTIVGTVASGIISITVFSFSMVMIVMNQAASQMSNRILDRLIGNPFQKLVLGFYIGTIVYSLLLLSSISESSDDKMIPSFSIYLLMLIAIIDIFLFVYFLHYITQSIRYGQLIQGVHSETKKLLQKHCFKLQSENTAIPAHEGETIMAPESGYFQGFSKKQLVEKAVHEDIVIQMLHPTGSYVLAGTPFLIISSHRPLDKNMVKKLLMDIDFYYGQEIDKNVYYGFHHLMEVGVKALSPGINDPGTAILSLHALTDLLAYKMTHAADTLVHDAKGNIRVITRERSFEELLKHCVVPIWDYGKEDRLIQDAMENLVKGLSFIDKENRHAPLLEALMEDVKAQIKGQ